MHGPQVCSLQLRTASSDPSGTQRSGGRQGMFLSDGSLGSCERQLVGTIVLNLQDRQALHNHLEVTLPTPGVESFDFC